MPLFDSSPMPLPDEAPSTLPLAFRLVTDAVELEALAPAWQQLLDESDAAEPMRSPAWLLPWWRIYGPSSGHALRVGLFFHEEQLVGLMPLCQRRVWHRGGIPFTRLEFLGADGDEPDGVCSEYLGLVARRGWTDRVLDAFAQRVHGGAFGPWHEMVLASMNGAEPQADRLRSLFASLGYLSERQTVTEAPYVTLPSSMDEYLRGLKASKRRYFTHTLRAFEQWAGDDWRIETATTPETLERGRAILHELHNRRWSEGDGIDGAFSRPRFAEFHAEVMSRLLREGKLDLFWLLVRGEPIAVYYQIRANRKIYYYQSGRKLDVPDKVRPGIVIAIHALNRAIDDRLREYDFLGGLLHYKLQFTKETRPLVELRIARSGPREWARRGVVYLIGCARKIRAALRDG